MSKPSATALDASRPTINDCWNGIGVRGDSSCPELKKYIHCRNCPVYATAAVDLLDAELPADHLAHWTSHVAQAKPLVEIDRQAVVVFRIGDEWLALPSILFKEIANPGVIHAVPHRRNGVALGLANIRGELLACVSLREVLSLQAAKEGKRDNHHAAGERFMVIQRDGNRLVCPVDEVHGILRFHRRQQIPVPATLAKATATYTLALLPWQQESSVGLLDDQLLFYTLNRSLA
ncbi:chemotaxis protein CheW [Aromatoleum diolicum]|uniref:Chemotaxis protein CheW n=1 Tax=Aromatoleum diolicum TaxID=75796 RepID=A0ABX1QHK2_9RHOO|nr:chemotaxis protein CheW [Aromatoleum diolicum]NMG76936.1 chemotaxis protein CheW [Aromatoleum diolicum]